MKFEVVRTNRTPLLFDDLKAAMEEADRVPNSQVMMGPKELYKSGPPRPSVREFLEWGRLLDSFADAGLRSSNYCDNAARFELLHAPSGGQFRILVEGISGDRP